MDSVTEFFSQNWIALVVVGSLLLFILPWLFVWRYRANRRNLLLNGRSAQAKILEIKASGLTIGSSSSDSGGGSMRGVNLLLEVYPENGQPYQVKTRDQLHLLDLSRIAPGMMVAVKVDPNNPSAWPSTLKVVSESVFSIQYSVRTH
jgi:type II secretory pathway pseudopilin PulG